jgi:hypothetical protein
VAEEETLTGVERPPDDAGEGLRQALLRMTSPGYTELRERIDALRRELAALEHSLDQAEHALGQRDDGLAQEGQALRGLLDAASARQAQLEVNLHQLEARFHADLSGQAENLHAQISALQTSIASQGDNSERVAPVLLPLLYQQAREESAQFAEAVAPVIGPAIRRQIRDAKQDIVDALYPLIGQIIGKAISEAIRELARNVDARLHNQLNFKERMQRSFQRTLLRLRGVSDAEAALREGLPYQVHRVLLIQRQSGLLLSQRSAAYETVQDDAEIISAMLSAIRSFVQDSFSSELGELGEITFGAQRILLESAQSAFLAVVISGVEPQGFHQQLRGTLDAVAVQFEREISGFSGDMQTLPDFNPYLAPLLDTHAMPPAQPAQSGKQLLIFGGVALGLLLLLGALAFACVFTLRLWPLAFK